MMGETETKLEKDGKDETTEDDSEASTEDPEK